MSAKLTLVRSEENSLYLLQGEGDPSSNADFSLYDLDGEGGDPFAFGSISWSIVPGVYPERYDPDDMDSFHDAREAVLRRARQIGIVDSDEPALHRDRCSCGDERCWVWQSEQEAI